MWIEETITSNMSVAKSAYCDDKNKAVRLTWCQGKLLVIHTIIINTLV